jgi:hypothetical protein
MRRKGLGGSASQLRAPGDHCAYEVCSLPQGPWISAEDVVRWEDINRDVRQDTAPSVKVAGRRSDDPTGYADSQRRGQRFVQNAGHVPAGPLPHVRHVRKRPTSRPAPRRRSPVAAHRIASPAV